MERIAAICDNVPVHAGLETVVEEPEFAGVEIIRTAPYSAHAVPLITPILCVHACNHIQKHFVGCLALLDLVMGV